MPDATTPAPFGESLLAETSAEWLAMVARRHSWRSFDGLPADGATLMRLGDVCSAFRPYPDARAELVARPKVDVFRGLLGLYGKVVGAPHLLVFIGDEHADYPDQHVGYTGEAIVLEATRLGLDTCWVGGFFSERRVAQVVRLGAGERVYAVSPVGFAEPAGSVSERMLAGFAGAHRRKRTVEIAPGIARGSWPQWAVAAAETVRLAPSAMNRQPWRCRFEDGAFLLAKDNGFETPRVSKRLDIGIAMLHADLAARAHGVIGRWTDLPGLDVARFDPVA